MAPWNPNGQVSTDVPGCFPGMNYFKRGKYPGVDRIGQLLSLFLKLLCQTLLKYAEDPSARRPDVYPKINLQERPFRNVNSQRHLDTSSQNAVCLITQGQMTQKSYLHHRNCRCCEHCPLSCGQGGWTDWPGEWSCRRE